MSPLKKTVSIIGIGRVGLPMALVLADEGYKTHGIGRDQTKIDSIAKGIMPFIEDGAPALLKKWINKKFFPTTSYNVISESDIVILTLGTPIDENMNPVLDQIDAAFSAAIPHFKKGQLIILRSTVSPRTTEYVCEVINKKSKLKVGKDLFLAFCPERIAEGKAVEEIKGIPQIVGGIDEVSTKKATEFFESFGVTCLPTDSRSAELAKLFTNMYRYINFAISNEFMTIAENYERNIHEIIHLVNYKYKRGGLALPGLTGGPCLFKDGFFLINENPFLDLIAASWKINESMPLFIINKLKQHVEIKNKKVALLGLAFKPELDDIRESLSFKMRKALIREHADLTLHDPYVKKYSHQVIASSLAEAVKDADIVVIAMRHKYYEKEKNTILKLIKKSATICDVWNVFGANKIIYKASLLKNK